MSKSPAQPWTTARKPPLANGQLKPQRQVVRQTPTESIRWAGVARWLHLYLSVISFAIVLFFAVTGLTLNHADWFDGASQTTEFKGQLNPNWVAGSDTAGVDKLAIVEFLRSKHAIKGAVTDIRMDDRQCEFSFRGPGYTADVFINRPAASYQLTETRMGLIAVVNDLHKGRDTGTGWRWLIDIAALFMTMVSLTGLFLLLFLKKRRASGLWWIAAGAGLSMLAYWWLVP